MIKNPYPETITDECTGQVFPDKEHIAWQAGYEAILHQMIPNTVRPNWEEYFLKLAMLTAERSTCLRHHVGAVAVKDRHILSGGYNGAPSGMKDCLELGCLRDKLGIPSGERVETCKSVHAEMNAIIQASLYGISLWGATIYCTHPPCRMCAKMLVNARITRFITYGTYADHAFEDIFQEAQIAFIVLPKPANIITEKE